MTTTEIAAIRKAASDMDAIARRFAKESKPDRIIANAIDHLFAMAAAEEAKAK